MFLGWTLCIYVSQTSRSQSQLTQFTDLSPPACSQSQSPAVTSFIPYCSFVFPWDNCLPGTGRERIQKSQSRGPTHSLQTPYPRTPDSSWASGWPGRPSSAGYCPSGQLLALGCWERATDAWTMNALWHVDEGGMTSLDQLSLLTGVSSTALVLVFRGEKKSQKLCVSLFIWGSRLSLWKTCLL